MPSCKLHVVIDSDNVASFLVVCFICKYVCILEFEAFTNTLFTQFTEYGLFESKHVR